MFEIGAIVPVAECISNEEASLIEPLACCINGINQIKSYNFESAIILGDGPIGIMQLMLLQKYFPKLKVGVCGKVEHRLKTAHQMGANMTYFIEDDQKNEENIKTIKKFCGSSSPNLIFVSNNSPSSINLASSLANKAGRIVLFSGIKKVENTNEFESTNIDSNLIHYNQVSIHGSFSSIPANLKEAMNLVQRKEIKLKDLISETFSLEGIHDAIRQAESFKGFKSVINKF
jgi:L-iditol 2-dehydrogenase